MPQTVRAVVRNGKIELLDSVVLPEGRNVMVTLLPEEEAAQFWQQAVRPSLDAIWDNPEDDVYADLLKE